MIVILLKTIPKKGVTFDAMETLERNSDCIDRLTSLVSDMKMTMGRKQPHISQEITRVGPGIKIQTNKILCPEIDPIVEEETKVEIDEIIEVIIGPITEID